MKVLIFANPTTFKDCNVEFQGWVNGVVSILSNVDDLQIGIAFTCYYSETSYFKINNISYFPISLGCNNNFYKWKFKFFNKIEVKNEKNRIKTIINEFNPSVIHIFGTEYEFGKLVDQFNTPYIIHIQSMVNPYLFKWFPQGYTYTKVLRYSFFTNLIKGAGVFHAYLRFKKQASREREIFKTCKYYFGRTSWDKDLITLFSPNAQYFHCEETINQLYFNTSFCYKIRPTFIITTVINPNLYKGLEIIIYTTNILLYHNFCNFKWNIIGFESNSELVQICMKSHQFTSIPDNIDFLGNISSTNIIDILLLTNAYIHTSHIENSSNSICEAMAMGLPVIAMSCGGTDSLITNMEDGILFPNNDPFILASRILFLFNNSEFSRRLGQQARKTAFKRHDRKKIRDTLLNTYKLLIQSKAQVEQ